MTYNEERYKLKQMIAGEIPATADEIRAQSDLCKRMLDEALVGTKRVN